MQMEVLKDEPEVSVIIPTMATPVRAESLTRAINSIRTSSSQPVKIIIVVNGNKYDMHLLKWIDAQPDIFLHRQEMPSAPEAIRSGRALVSTEYFSTLDDDDEYLNGAIDLRLSELRKSPQTAVVVTNGYRNRKGLDEPCYKSLADIPTRPLLALMEIPWLNSANAMYRSAAVGIDYFENSHPYAEWTWLAFSLAMHEKQFAAIDTPTFRINDTSDSLSKSQAYDQAYESLFERMLAERPPVRVVNKIRQKMGSMYHQYADRLLNEGDRVGALRWHVRSLAQPSGFRYLSFTRRLFFQRHKHTSRASRNET